VFVELGTRKMDVRIQKARHQKTPGAVDDPGIARHHRSIGSSDPEDTTLLQLDPHLWLRVPAGAIEQRSLFEDQSHLAADPRHSGLDAARRRGMA